jgi:hypothetical protein
MYGYEHYERMHDPLKAFLRSIPFDCDIQYPITGKPVINAEPLIGDNGVNRHIVVSLTKPNVDVYDFDRRNTDLLNQLGYSRAFWMPCLWSQGLQDMVDRVSDKDRIYDITHIGIPTGRREQVIKEIEALGVRVNIVNGVWEDDATRIMKQSKVIINIHREGAKQAQECLRISWALACGCLVVSETSLDPSIPQPCIIEADLWDLARVAVEAVGLADESKERLDIFRLYSKEVIKKTWLKGKFKVKESEHGIH